VRLRIAFSGHTLQCKMYLITLFAIHASLSDVLSKDSIISLMYFQVLLDRSGFFCVPKSGQNRFFTPINMLYGWGEGPKRHILEHTLDSTKRAEEGLQWIYKIRFY